jgi:molecular chaperone DnaK
MSKDTITIGIDLGTTNSSIAVSNNGKTEIIKKPGSVEYIPSVFGFDKKKNKVVGQKAYDYLYKFNSKDEEKNFKAEIKREMGTSEKIKFDRPNIMLGPEEISAEILKSLKEDLLKKYPDYETSAAVITVPAAFSVLQSEATKRAGNLAGFKHVVLLQEPIAAAVSYGFGKQKDQNWLIYDFGGGTFDVALISSKEGILSVLSHNGDNFLGGKNIDWDIVDKIIVPKIQKKYSFSNFSRSNKKYSTIFSKLKYYAETAKIELSQYKKTTIELEDMGEDDEGKEICLSIAISRSEFENIIKPIIDRTIQLSKETLKDAGIKKSSVNKIVLVGGPTQIPYLRKSLENELNIKVDSSVDPLTVVAHGASVYGMSKKIPKEFLVASKNKKKAGVHNISLNYVTLTSDSEESVTGIIEGLKDNEEYYIQIQSESGTFSGPKTKINKGKFYYPVNISSNKQNLFWVYLFNSKGNSVKISQDSFTITHGLSVSGAPIPHSVGVVVASKDFSYNQITNVVDKIFEKGEVLPLKETLDIYKTSRKLKKGENNSLDIIIVEGESDIPDRNGFLCELGIKGKELPHDLPEGTPIELTLEMNESRELTVTAYIPLIDITLNARYTIKDEAINIDGMSDELNLQRERMETLSDNCSTKERKEIADSMQSVSQGIENSKIDEDEKRKASKHLRDLKIILDQLVKGKEMPLLAKENSEKLEDLEQIINEYSDPKDRKELKSQLKSLEIESKKVIEDNDKTQLIRINEQLDELKGRAFYSNPNTWIAQFEDLSQNGKFINEKEAKYYINKGIKAINSEDIEELKRCMHQLTLLLVEENEQNTKLSGITR